ncbi:acetyl/propionyl/methylcrotonyl-CoA carboxylase subunit alpha [Brevibacterium samyangense]|uniref:biotin carboxylase n=1 Tax=Brevibacterium samyangense TaxID=366888 RepID=A0ABN2TBK0_9MICO
MQRILIANRGEIAVRVVRACAEAGLTSIAVYADQDADALHVRLADEAYGLGGTTPADSYLDIPRLLEVARASRADAVHPGYGFLSENAEFARAVEAAGLTFIGPTPETIEQLGDKVTARRIAAEVGAPLVPGSDGPVTNAQEAVAFAQEAGLPIAIKAAFGGGGRGLKVVRTLEEVPAAFESATREAVTAFGRGECFVERFLDRPRHVEVQIVGDGTGEVLVVGDRDCSLQRRNQKLVEEAPAPGLPADVRTRIHEAARAICAATAYRGTGTVEFLLGEDGTVSFLEVNTRLQVEHPVTELTSGIDLVREQFRIAAGEGLSRTDTPEPRGHAIEFRINAEDPGRGFLPSPGLVTGLRQPGGPGVRWDSGVEAGGRVESAFDSLLAKLIVHADDRGSALARARRALTETEVSGVATVLPFHRAVVDHPAFTGGSAGTGAHTGTGPGASTDTGARVGAGSGAGAGAGASGRDDRERSGFGVYTQWIESEFLPALDTHGVHAQDRSVLARPQSLERIAIEVDGRRVELGLPEDLLTRLGAGTGVPGGGAPRERNAEARAGTGEHAGSGEHVGAGENGVGGSPGAGAAEPAGDPAGALLAPVTGPLVRRLVEDGTEVRPGDAVAVMEAMKMETQVVAERAGRLMWLVAEGDTVPVDAPLARIE